MDDVAGNGLIDRRALLGQRRVLAGALRHRRVAHRRRRRAAEGRSLEPGARREDAAAAGAVAVREERGAHAEQPENEMRTSHARTPHHLLNGTVTPNSLHFSINHSGIPDIDPAKHRLVIHGMVKQPLAFTLETLSRYPLVDPHGVRRVQRQLRADVLQRAGAGDRAGAARPRIQCRVDRRSAVDPARRGRHRPLAKWVIAEGADLLALHRSVPVKKAYDDALVAIYQNGERLMPGNGYPMRLLLPGYQGNMNVKFLRRIKVVDQPSLELLRGAHLFAGAAGRQGLALPLPAGGEELHHPARRSGRA